MFSGGWQPSGSGSDPTKVPYTGATADVDLGSYSIRAYKVEATNEINTDNGVITSDVIDGASAIAYNLNTTNTLSNASAKLLSLKNNGSEKIYIDKDGNIIGKNFETTNTTFMIKMPAGSTLYYVWVGSSSYAINSNALQGFPDEARDLGSSTYKWKSLYLKGGAHFIGYTSSASDPSTTELPTNKDFGFHKNTTSGNLFLAFNDGGSIKKVQLT